MTTWVITETLNQYKPPEAVRLRGVQVASHMNTYFPTRPMSFPSMEFVEDALRSQMQVKP